MNSTPKPPTRSRNTLLDALCAQFPVFREAQPLAIGIHKAIKVRLPETEGGALRNALKIHTASTKYLKNLSQAKTRFDLEGAEAGEVTEEQRQQASQTLKDRFKKAAERKRAEEAEKQRQDKLHLLVERFKKS